MNRKRFTFNLNNAILGPSYILRLVKIYEGSRPVKYSTRVGRLGLSLLGDQVGRTRDIPPAPDTKPKLTGNLKQKLKRKTFLLSLNV